MISIGFQCPGGNQTGPFPDQTNCNFYFLCSGNVAYRLACPAGLQYNVAANRCDFPYIAQCTFGGVPATIVPPTGSK